MHPIHRVRERHQWDRSSDRRDNFHSDLAVVNYLQAAQGKYRSPREKPGPSIAIK